MKICQLVAADLTVDAAICWSDFIVNKDSFIMEIGIDNYVHRQSLLMLTYRVAQKSKPLSSTIMKSY